MDYGFVMLPSYYDAIRPLPDADRLAMLDAIMDYAFLDKVPDTLSPILNGYFSLLRPNIDASIKRYRASVENGQKGGRPPKKKPTGNPTKTREEPNENHDKDMDVDMDFDRDMEGEKKNPDNPPRTRSKFVPPTFEEVTLYVKERGSKVDPQGFIDFYAAKGWQIGKNTMKDWKAACRNAESWERWDKKPDNRNAVKTAADYDD